MELLTLPIFYVFALSYLVFRIPFFQKLNFQSPYLTALLAALKMLAGALYIFYHFKLSGAGDINGYIRDGLIIFNQIEKSPLNFLQLVFGLNNVEIPEHLSNPIYSMGYWEDTSAYMVIRFNALFSLISFGNIYVYGIFSGFLSFTGCYLIALSLKKFINAGTLTLLSLFLFPPILYWTSGPHKEYLSLLSLGMILYGFTNLIQNKKLTYLLLFFAGLAVLTLVRQHIAALLIPCLISFYFVEKFRFNHILTYTGVFAAFVLAGTFIKIPFADATFVEMVLNKKALFESLRKGNTFFELDAYHTALDIFINIPQALLNTLSRPFFWEISNIKLLVISVESFFITLITIAGIASLRKLNSNEKNLILLLISFSFAYLILTGLIVPNWGAIIRYRSVALAFMIPALVFSISKNNFFNKILQKLN